MFPAIILTTTEEDEVELLTLMPIPITQGPVIEFPATSCDEQEPRQHAYMDTANRAVGDHVTFMCDVGYTFPDGGQTRTSLCRSSGTWSIDVPDCIRKSTLDRPMSSAINV